MTSTITPQIHTLPAISFSSSPTSTKPTNLCPRTVFFKHGLILKTTPFSLITANPRFSVSTNAKASPSGEQKWTHEGSVTESLPNGMFRVLLDNKDMIIGYISGKIRKNFVRILPGDRVKVEVSRYDSTRGRIVYRNRNNKDSSRD